MFKPTVCIHETMTYDFIVHICRILTNYAKWQLCFTYLQLLDEDCVAAYQKFKMATTVSSGSVEREDMCVDIGWTVIPIAQLLLYVDVAFPEDSKVGVDAT